MIQYKQELINNIVRVDKCMKFHYTCPKVPVMRSCRIICLATMLWFASFVVNANSVLVNTRNGDIKGTVENGILVWKGIPYAQPPVGALRYKNPQAVKPWNGVLDATEFKTVCPQYDGLLTYGEKKNEDCLFLNIWSPAADGKKRPVMFWIHGGGFMSGSGSSDMYDGATLAKKGDVVIVTINYRLGPFGLLYFKDIAKHGEVFDNNLAIKDQIMALRWVHDNIASFGGDPNSVTIFGESAGARSVLALMGAPDAQGLFNRAIAQSATPNFSWTPKEATRVTQAFLEVLGIPLDSLEKLRDIPADTLVQAVGRLDKKLLGTKGWNRVFTPTIDDEPSLYGKLGLNAGKVDLLIGTNMDEANLFTTKQMGMMPKKLKGLRRYFEDLDSAQVVQVTTSYKKLGYPHKKGIHRLLTDAIFRVPSIAYADAHAENNTVFMYRFDWSSGALKLVGLRAFHGVELPFVFGNLDAALAKKMLVMSSKKKVQSMADQIQRAWINFAHTGNPNNPEKNEWPHFTSQHRATWIFNNKNALEVDPDSLQRKAWIGVDF